MNAICKFNKHGHCRYGQFCHFTHENRKCEDKSCDVKNCNFRHPKLCMYKLKNQKCKFDEVCAFDHDVGNVHVQETVNADATTIDLVKKIKHMENQIKTQNHEIETLRSLLLKSRISQLDGDDSIEEEDTSRNDSDDDLELSKSSGSEQMKFVCPSKSHKFSCVECNLVFKTKDSHDRHIECKTNLTRIDDQESPTGEMKLEAICNDEICLTIVDMKTRDNLILLHSNDCWSQTGHQCGHQKKTMNKDTPKHMLICSLVLGDLSMDGCYLDWVSVETILAPGYLTD